MKLIAWDTSSKAGALVAITWNPGEPARERFQVVSEWTLNVDAGQHSEKLLWGVHQMLDACNWKLEDVDLYGVGVGPGSFTGLRIGMTTARTLATTMGKPLIGVSSLAALARPIALQYAPLKQKTLVIATTDAAKNELFALYGAAKSIVDCAAMSDQEFPGLWKRGVEEEALPAELLMKSIKKKLTPGTKWVAIGEGKNRYPDLWKKLPASSRLECDLPGVDYVQGRYLGALVWECYQAGLARNALEVHPRYLRGSEAETKLKAGLLQVAPPLRKEEEEES